MWVLLFFIHFLSLFFLSIILSFIFDFLVFNFLFFLYFFPPLLLPFINIHSSWTKNFFFNFNFQRWWKKRGNLFLLFCLGFGSNNFVGRGRGNHLKLGPMGSHYFHRVHLKKVSFKKQTLQWPNHHYPYQSM
jgi:hypothetical protein